MLTNEEFLRVVEATPLVSIDLVIRSDRGEVLLGKRVNRPAKDMWFVPGGRIKKNERVAEALKRISLRELGVEITDATLIGAFDHIYDDNFAGAPGVNTHYVVLAYACELPQSIPLTPDEQHSAMRWWTVAELLESTDVHDNTKAYFRG